MSILEPSKVTSAGLDAATATKIQTLGTATRGAIAVASRDAVSIYLATDLGIAVSATENQAPAINAAIESVPAGSIIKFPAGDYLVGSTVTLNKRITIQGPGRLVANHDTPAVDITADNVTIDGNLALVGRQRTTWISGASGIRINGTLATPIRYTHIGKVSLSTFGGGGIDGKFVQDFTSTDTTIDACAYYGIMLFSANRATIVRPKINDISGSGQVNAYGITATRLNGTLEDQPRSRDVLIEDGTISNVPLWAGIDTHGGERITARRCIVTGCKKGIDFVAADDATNTTAYAPLDVLIESCVVDGTGVATSHGIGVSGADSAPGTVVEYATGTVVNCRVVRAGDPANNSLGGYWFRATRGLRVYNIRAVEPGSHGVVFMQNNLSFIADGVEVTDPWSDTHTIPAAIATRSTYNTGIVSGMYGRRGTKTATTVLAYGFYQSDPATTTTIEFTPNCAVEAGALIAEASSGLRTRMVATASMVTIGRGNGRLAFFGSTPTVKAAVTGSRADGTALANLLTELAAKGLITNSTTA